MFKRCRLFLVVTLPLMFCPLAIGQSAESTNSFALQSISAADKIVLLPAVDARTNNKPKVNLQGLRKYTKKALERKHYSVVQADSTPANARWVFVVTVNSLGPGFPMAQVSGKLSDANGGVVWYGSGTGAYQSASTLPHPGRLTMQDATADQLTDALFLTLLSGSARGTALNNAVLNLLQSLPSLPKPEKK